MSTTGRPTKLDDLTSKRIVDAIRDGNTRQCAAQLGGVHKATLLDWLARGRSDEQPFADFADRVAKADAEAEAEMVGCVRDAAKSGAPGTWRAALEWLQHRRRATWKRASDPERAAVNEAAKLAAMTDEELLAALDVLRKDKQP
jgi:hypothetical protein